MLLSSVIIVLREVLEAALLISILIALSKKTNLNTHWFLWSCLLGLLGAIVYGMNINSISDWFDGVGQEVTNAFIQLFIYCMLVFYILILSRFLVHKNTSLFFTRSIMILIVALAITREGTEIILYFFSVTHSKTHSIAVVVGMTIGASIGVSVGFLFYYLLNSLKLEKSIFIGLILLLLVSAGMVSQASLLLIQADWLPAQLPLWNSSVFISEKSVTGQLLYALLGYESTPTALQVSLYVFAIIVPIGLIQIIKKVYSKKINSVAL